MRYHYLKCTLQSCSGPMTIHAFPRKTTLDYQNNTDRGEIRFKINPLSQYNVSGRQKRERVIFILAAGQF